VPAIPSPRLAFAAPVAPWEHAAEEIEPVQEGVNYWHRVAGGENYEYDAATGGRLEI